MVQFFRLEGCAADDLCSLIFKRSGRNVMMMMLMMMMIMMTTMTTAVVVMMVLRTSGASMY